MNNLFFCKKSFTFLFLAAYLFPSCTKRLAVTHNQSSTIHSGAEVVLPAWQYKQTVFSKTAPFIMSLGITSAYFSESLKGLSLSSEQERNKALGTGLGVALVSYYGSYLLKSTLFKTKAKTQVYKPAQANEWLNVYNKQNNSNYVLIKNNATNKDIIIIPPQFRTAYEIEQRKIDSIAKARKERPLDYVVFDADALFEGQIFPSWVLGMSGYKGSKNNLKDISSGLSLKITNNEILNHGSRIKYEIEDAGGTFISKTTQELILGQKGVTEVKFPAVAWKTAELRKNYSEKNVRIIVRLIDEFGNKKESIVSIQLRSINDCPIQWRSLDLTYMFGAYINEGNIDLIDPILKDGIEKNMVKQWVGYQFGAKYVDEQIIALWRTLNEKGFRYSSVIPQNTCNNSELYCQPVRLFSQALKTEQANCIDGVIVFASILNKIGINTEIIMVPGHAFLGYYREEGDNDLQFVETTMLGKDVVITEDMTIDQKAIAFKQAFENARIEGTKKYLYYKDKGEIKHRYNTKKLRSEISPIGD